MFEKSIIAVGHPRCGSGFTSYYLTLLGIPCVHEIGHKLNGLHGVKYDALSDWGCFVEHEPNDGISTRHGLNGYGFRSQYKFKQKIVFIRNPFDSFKAIIHENKVKWSFDFRNKYIENVLNKNINSSSYLERAIKSWLYTYTILVDIKGYFYFRIEHDLDKLHELIKEKVKENITIPPNETINTKVNSKTHGEKVNKHEYSKVDPRLMEELNEFCKKVGYPTFDEYFSKNDK
jgi:hypothetical protein